MRVAPVLVARPPKAKAVDVTAAPLEIATQAGCHCGGFRPVMEGSLEGRRQALRQLLAERALVLDGHPGMFVYRVAHEGRRWVGLVCCLDPAELLPVVSGHDHDLAASAVLEEMEAIGWQLEPAVVHCQMPEGVAELLIGDTNERPAYHFVATTGGTHSAWIIRDHAPYVRILVDAAPLRIARGTERVIAAHRAGHPVLVILTQDLADHIHLPPLLAPRSGLFLAPTSEQAVRA